MIAINAIIPQVSKETENRIIVAVAAIITQQPENRKRETIADFATVFGNKSHTQTFLALTERKVITTRILSNLYNIESSQICRSLKEFSDLGLVNQIEKAKLTGKRSGPKSIMWALPGYTPDDVQKAVATHQQLSTPLLSVSDKVAQIILDEYLTPRHRDECKLIEIGSYIRRHNPGFPYADFQNSVSKRLLELGVKVWR